MRKKVILLAFLSDLPLIFMVSGLALPETVKLAINAVFGALFGIFWSIVEAMR